MEIMWHSVSHYAEEKGNLASGIMGMSKISDLMIGLQTIVPESQW